jgi:hypothetical protein
VSEIADQVCDGVLFNGAAAPLKNRERLGGGAHGSELGGVPGRDAHC